MVVHCVPVQCLIDASLLENKLMGAKKGSKYYPLYQYLKTVEQDQIKLSFPQIEEMLGVALPKSARRNKAWWSNRRTGGLQSAAWIGASFRIKEVDLDGESIHFQRRGLVMTYEVEEVGGTILWNGEMVRALRDHMDYSQAELADEMGMRQQTISDWETGAHKPTRSTSRYLGLIAERAGFQYNVKPED